VKKVLIMLLVLCGLAVAQDRPRIAVYVTGNFGENEKKVLGTRMLASLVNSGRYKGIERSNSFLAEIEKEQFKQRSGEIDDSQISALGKQFGVKFVCISDITPALGAYQVSARIVDVETAEVIFIGESYSALKNVVDLVSVSDQVVKNMFGAEATTIRKGDTKRDAAAIREPAFKPAVNPAPKPEPKPSASEPSGDDIVDARPASPPKPVPAPAPAPKPAPKPVPAPSPAPKPAPAPKSEPEESAGIRFSAGAGGFYASDFGGGVKNGGSAAFSMPYNGVGVYLFFDAAYLEVFGGYSGGSGPWVSGPGVDPAVDMRRTYLSGGIFAKYPIDVGLARLFPIVGIDYEASMSFDISGPGGRAYDFGAGDAHAGVVSALWFKFGGGVDFDVTERVYIRAELLYGVRTANKLENDIAGRDSDREANLGHGVTFRVGGGVRF